MKPRKPSSTSQKSDYDQDAQQRLLVAQDFQPREIPPQQFIIPYSYQKQFPEYAEQPFTPQPYMQHSTPLHEQAGGEPLESDL